MAASRALGAASATASTGPAGGAAASARRLAASASAPAAGGSSGSGGSGQANAQERWYFTREQLSKSPSRVCGLDADKELAYRQQAANLIQDMGQRLQVSQLCINTAIVYMHRFYAFHSFTQFHRNAMAAAALFLAAKVEEQPRKLEHVIKVAHLCLHRGEVQPTLDVQSKHYQEQAQDLVFNENVLLQTLGFDVAIDHPHTHVVRTCNLIKATKDLAQTSYFMASNSLHLTTMCLQYRPTVVACFCIHLASKWSNWEIPQSNEGKHWFYYVDRSVTGELLEHLTAEFLHIFDRCPARLKKKIKSISNAQGTNSPQQPSASHSNSNSASFSSKEKDQRKAPSEDCDKIEYDKRLLFGPSIPVNPSLVPNPNKMDYREYKERQQQHQDRRRQPVHPSNSMPRPPEAPPSGSQSRQSGSTSNPPPLSQGAPPPPSQHRWPPSQRSKDANQSMRPHPTQSSSSSSSRPHHRSSSSNVPPQIPPQSHGPPPTAAEQRPQSRSQLPNMQAQPQSQPPPHSSRAHSQPQVQQQPQPPPPQPQIVQQLIQQPPQRPPSLFSPPEPQRKPQVSRRPPVTMAPLKDLPTPLSPFSSSPPSMSQLLPEPEQIQPNKKEELPPIEPQPNSLPPINSVETDPGLVSNLLKESLPHKADKKKKKDKHKHKDRDKREEKKKHKKDKDKRREMEANNPPIFIAPPANVPPQAPQPPQPANPLRITIPKEAYANVAPHSSPPTKFKIKIPKDRLRTEPPPVPVSMPPQGLKIKIPKELVEGSRKRPHDGATEHGGPHKAPRMPQHPSQQHKVSQQHLQFHRQAGGYPNPPPPIMMMYPHHFNPPPVMMYQHPPPPNPYFYPHGNVYSRPPPAPNVPPLPPQPPPPPPPPPP